MRIIAETMNHQKLQMELAFTTFVEGTLGSHLCHEDENPYEVLSNCLPTAQVMKAMPEARLCQEVEQACLRASHYECHDESFDYLTPVKIKVDRNDIAVFKQHFFLDHGLEVVQQDEAV